MLARCNLAAQRLDVVIAATLFVAVVVHRNDLGSSGALDLASEAADLAFQDPDDICRLERTGGGRVGGVGGVDRGSPCRHPGAGDNTESDEDEFDKRECGFDHDEITNVSSG